MKNIILFILISSGSFAQVGLPHDKLGKVNYTEVVQSDSFPASQLYSNARLWFAETFKSANDVIQLADENTKTLVGHGSTTFLMHGLFGSRTESGFITYSVKIECKDGRYKYSITDFVLKQPNWTYTVEDYKGTAAQEDNLYSQVQDIGEGLATTLKAKMKSSINSKEDW